VLASENAVERKLGHRYQRVEEMEDDPDAPRGTFFSRVSQAEAEYGLAPALAFAAAMVVGVGASAITLPILVAAGSGFAVGGVLGRLIHQHHAERLREQLERGGLVLWVSTRNTDEETRAMQVLQKHSAHDVHAHAMSA
jgi:hypothetical protein